MHVLIGLVLVASALVGARWLDGMTFGQFGHAGTILLVCLGPLGAAIMAFDGRSLLVALRSLVEAIGGRSQRRRREVLAECYEVGRLLRAGRPLEASRILSASPEPLLGQSAALLLSRTSGADLGDTLATLSYRRLMDIRTGEELFASLSRAAPAFGLIGTILGLVDMLHALKDFDKLGPGMALAVMSTFYGLVISQSLYVPLAKVIERYGQDSSVTAELLARALGAIADGRSLAEVRVLADNDQLGLAGPAAAVVANGAREEGAS